MLGEQPTKDRIEAMRRFVVLHKAAQFLIIDQLQRIHAFDPIRDPRRDPAHQLTRSRVAVKMRIQGPHEAKVPHARA